jgi:FkbM family methyltransferase
MSLRNKLNGFREIWYFDNRWQLLLNRLFFRDERINIYRLKGMNILVDHFAGDANGAREVIVSPMYRQFIPQMKLDSPVNVLDIGANNGGFPLMLRANQISLKKVVSVELNPNTFMRMRFNLERNSGCDFTGINAAICGEAREFEVRLGEGSAGDSIYAQEEASNGELFHVKGMTFDDIYSSTFGEQIVDICKMDVEGAEYEVFSTPFHQKLTRCRYLIIEIHDGDGRNPGEVIERLEQLKFKEQLPPARSEPAVHFFVNTDLNLP